MEVLTDRVKGVGVVSLCFNMGITGGVTEVLGVFYAVFRIYPPI